MRKEDYGWHTTKTILCKKKTSLSPRKLTERKLKKDYSEEPAQREIGVKNKRAASSDDEPPVQGPDGEQKENVSPSENRRKKRKLFFPTKKVVHIDELCF